MDKTITQKNDYGCGAASVAYVLGRPYLEIVKKLGVKKANTFGFYCKELVSVLNSYDHNYNFKYIKPKLRKKIYKINSIVFIKRDKNYPAGHFIARGNGKWMDSWINFKETKNIKEAKSGFRKKLPGTPIYLISEFE